METNNNGTAGASSASAASAYSPQVSEFIGKVFAGLGVENIVELANQKESSPDVVKDLVRQKQQQWLENNPNDFVKSLQDREKARLFSAAEKKISDQFGLILDDAEMPADKSKRFEHIVLQAKKKYTSDNESLAKLQTDNINLSNELKKLKEEIIPTLETSASREIKLFKRNQKLSEIIREFNPVTKDMDLVLPGVVNRLDAMYHIDYDEKTNRLEILNKNSMTKVVDSTGYNELSLHQILKPHISDWIGIIQTNDGTQQQGRMGGQQRTTNQNQDQNSQNTVISNPVPGNKTAKPWQVAQRERFQKHKNTQNLTN